MAEFRNFVSSQILAVGLPTALRTGGDTVIIYEGLQRVQSNTGKEIDTDLQILKGCATNPCWLDVM